MRLRDDLPDHVYLWVNAAEGHTYTDAEAARWTALDPLFPYSRHPHRSAGLPCRTGESVVSVDGEGTVRRCHFVREELGNLYDGSYRPALRPRACPLAVCDCHIGYVHLETLPLYDVFAGGVLERIPAAAAPGRTPLRLLTAGLLVAGRPGAPGPGAPGPSAPGPGPAVSALAADSSPEGDADVFALLHQRAVRAPQRYLHQARLDEGEPFEEGLDLRLAAQGEGGGGVLVRLMRRRRRRLGGSRWCRG